jgi:hypothetical protein
MNLIDPDVKLSIKIYVLNTRVYNKKKENIIYIRIQLDMHEL